jgi:hypothetical protein
VRDTGEQLDLDVDELVSGTLLGLFEHVELLVLHDVPASVDDDLDAAGHRCVRGPGRRRRERERRAGGLAGGGRSTLVSLVYLRRRRQR